MSPGPARRRSPGPTRGRTGTPDPAERRGTEGGANRRGPEGTGVRRPDRRWQLVRAGSDAVPASTRRFMARARQRRVRAALPWAVAGGVLVVAGLVAWTLLGTGLFGVREVRVVGADLVTPVQVREAAAVPDDTPLARVDLAGVAARVGALAPVERAMVSRDWPGTLVVRLVERTPVAVVPQRGGYAVLDRSGVVYRTLAEAPPSLPVFGVAEPGPADPGTRAALEVLSVLTPELRARTREVQVEGLARISLRLTDGRTVFWGDATRGEEKARVATALLGQPGDRVDVSAPDVVTLK